MHAFAILGCIFLTLPSQSFCNLIGHIVGMKKISLVFLLLLAGLISLYGQNGTVSDELRKTLTSLIDQYSQAREKRDTVLLKTILTDNVDQLVSTGEWRVGIKAAVEGMMRSSANNPGARTLLVEKIQLITPSSAVVDCRYEIKNTDGTARKMWSTFIVVVDKDAWKIRSIRNMLPAPNN